MTDFHEIKSITSVTELAELKKLYQMLITSKSTEINVMKKIVKCIDDKLSTFKQFGHM